jgi:hypothetical protein
MGVSDAREQLEVCKDEYGKLERENAELRAETREVKTVRQLHEICGASALSMETALYATGILERLYKAEAQVAELQAVIERVRKHLETARVPVTAIRAISEVENILSTSGTEALEAAKAEAWDEGYESGARFHEGREKGRWEDDKPRKGIRTWVADPAPGNPYRKEAR